MGLPEDAVPYRRGQPRNSGSEQLHGRVAIQRRQLVLGEPVPLEDGLGSRAGGGEESDTASRQPPGDEAQDRRTGPVEPGEVVHDDEHRAFGCRSAQQEEHRVADVKLVGHRITAVAQRTAQNPPMCVSQAVEPVVQRQQQLVKTGVGEFGLEADADGRQDLGTRPGHAPGDLIEQHGLADPRLSGEQQGAARGRSGPEQRLDLLELPRTAHHPAHHSGG